MGRVKADLISATLGQNVIYVYIAKLRILALVDTGAYCTILSDKILTKLGLPIAKLGEEEFQQLRLADGKPVDLLGKADVTIKINGLAIPFQCRVLPNMAYDLILGLDFLEATRAKIDFEERVVTFYDNMTATTMTSFEKKPYVLYPKRPTVVPPHSEILIPMSVPKAVNSHLCLLEPLKPQRSQKFLCARSVVVANSDSTICRVLNPTDQVLWLSKRRPLVSAERVLIDNIFDEPLPQSSDNSLSNVSVSSPHPSSLPSPSTSNHALISGLLPPFDNSNESLDINSDSVTLESLGINCHSDSLTAQQNQKLRDLLQRNITVFAKSLADLSGSNLAPHTIYTKTEVPIRQRCYRHSAEAKKEMDRQVSEMLKAKIVEPSTSMWSSPVVLVKKKSGEIRMCCDFRALNKITWPIHFPLPTLNDVFDAMADAKATFFSSLDLKQGYLQISLDPATKEKTSFSTHSGNFNFLRLPFGLKNSPAAFNSLLAHVFKGLTFKSVLCYIDDILVYSRDFDTHLQHLQEVFDRLSAARLKLHPKKCSFALQKVLYLGHYLSAQGMEVDRSKVEIVEQYPRPKNQKELRSFIGFVGFYRRFVRKFCHLANPLHQLLRKDVEFLWDDVAEKSFNALKSALCNAPVLSYPDFSRPFKIQCDASILGISYILAQEDSSGKEHPICYGGRSLTPAERNYSITHLEALALVSAVKEFHCYIANSYFVVYSDHLCLKFLQSLKTSTTGRLLRWSLLLQPYHFDIEYKAGKKNTNVDALSRLSQYPAAKIDSTDEDTILAPLAPPSENLEPIPDVNVILESELVEPPANFFDTADIAEQQRLCPEVSTIIKYMEQGILPDDDVEARKLIFMANEYTLHDNILYHYYTPRSRKASKAVICQLVIPKHLRNKLLHGYHEENAHPGYHRTNLSLQRHYYWPRMYLDVQNHVASCESCQRCKISSKRHTLENLPIKSVFGRWHCDILSLKKSREGYRYLLVFVESLTRFPEAFPIKTQTASTIADILYNQIITRYGAMTALLSDRGPNLLSSIVAELSRKFGIKRLHTSGFRPQCNSPVERLNRTISSSLRILCKDPEDWPMYIPTILFSLRATTSPRLNHSPFFLMHGHNMRLGIDLTLPSPDEEAVTPDEHALNIAKRLSEVHQEAKDRTRLMQDYNKLVYDRNVSDFDFQPGQRVWLLTPQVKKGLSKKLSLRYSGPYYIASRVAKNTYLLRSNRTNRLLNHPINSERLKLYIDRHDFMSPTDDNIPSTSSDPAPNDSSVEMPDADNNQTPSQNNTDTTSSDWHPVDKLLAQKRVGMDLFYKVKWTDSSKCEWIHENNVTEALKRAFYVNKTKAGLRRKRRKVYG